MDELRGPNLQIVLHVKQGLGFGFLSSPFIVSGSVNGYILETDPVIPSHTTSFDTELVWEADKRRFRNLRIQNVPVKVEVYTTLTQGRKSKVGYFLLSLLGALPCPSSKVINVKPTWHRLLGVKSDGQRCQPQLLLSLTIEDWTNTPTPRNHITFHSNGAATYLPAASSIAPPLSFTIDDYIEESKKTATTPELLPHALTERGLIQIGLSPKHIFVLSFVLGAVENVDTILPVTEATDCSVTYSVFSQTIPTDKFSTTADGVRKTTVQFNQKTSLRLCTDLVSLSRYFSECPHVVTTLHSGDTHVGICCSNLQKLLPTGDINTFLESFSNNEKAVVFEERCFMLPCAEGVVVDRGRRPFIDLQISLKYVGKYIEGSPQKLNPLTARSASHLGCKSCQTEDKLIPLQKHKSTSCTEVDRDVGSVTYTKTAKESSRYHITDATNKTQNEVVDMIKKMYEQFTISQEMLLSSRIQPVTSEIDGQHHTPIQVTLPSQRQTDHIQDKSKESSLNKDRPTENNLSPIKHVLHKKEGLALSLPVENRENLMKKCVEELEDWKEQQQEIFKYQLKQKEAYHLELLSEEWNRKRSELESRLSRGIQQCSTLATDLEEATNDFRLRSYAVADREKKLSQAKQSLEQHYATKFQQLREASQKMEDDMRHQNKLRDMRIEELELELDQLQKENAAVKANVKNIEKEALRKNSALTKDQTAGLIQELRSLKEKLDEAEQSKGFFKEQWGRAVRELHSVRLQSRRQLLTQLQQERRHVTDLGRDNIAEREGSTHSKVASLKDDSYTNYITEIPILTDTSQTNSIPFIGDIELVRESVKMPKKSRNEQLNYLIEERDRLVQKENPDEEKVTKLNNQIRILLKS